MSYRNRGLDCPKFHQLLPKKGAKSAIWHYFCLPGDENFKVVTDDIVICKECRRPVASKGGSTSNLRSHLRLHHPVQFQRMLRYGLFLILHFFLFLYLYLLFF